MIKRVNFTGRKRIARNRVQIEVFDGEPRTFNATIDLNDLGFKPDAAVVLEAMCAGSNVVERFECGEVGKLRMILNWPLHEIGGENLFFTLKVVDRTKRFGRIRGLAENIRPAAVARSGDRTTTAGGGVVARSPDRATAVGRRGILPIEPRDLGEELWQLEFKSHDVYLLVNKDVPGLADRAQTDPLFFAVVYPEVIRRILKAAFDEHADIDDDDDRWPKTWLTFGKTLHSVHDNPPTGPDRDEECEEWIEDVVESFCKKHQLKSQYVQATRGTSGGER